MVAHGHDHQVGQVDTAVRIALAEVECGRELVVGRGFEEMDAVVQRAGKDAGGRRVTPRTQQQVDLGQDRPRHDHPAALPYAGLIADDDDLSVKVDEVLSRLRR